MDTEYITQEAQTEISQGQELDQVSTDEPECTIYRVHGHLRDLNPKAYEPEVIAIGPYHRDKDYLKMMEDHKLKYLDSLLRSGNHDFSKFVSVIGAQESKARDCYSKPVNLSSSEFIEMLVLDGCFIIELVRKHSLPCLRQKNDPIFRMDWILNSLQRDLMLFENQLPFFVLCNLFDLIEQNPHSRLMHLLSNFFKILYPGKLREGSSGLSSHKIKHLLDLMHRHWLPPSFHNLKCSNKNETKAKRRRFINHASGLREANLNFEKNEAVTVTVFDIKFRNGTILMAPLTIEDRTESILRNLIAYEQYFQDSPVNYITDYVKFLDCLIDSPKDVEILSAKGIVDNWLGDDKVVAKIVNSLLDSVAGPGSRFLYAEIFENVDKHCGKRRNWWMAILRLKHLNSPWTIISIIAAVFLLLLTVTQTLFTILQVV